MKKSEVELLIVGIKLGKEEILNMKIYKDGTLCRVGSGGMPTCSITGMTMEGDTKYWDNLIALVDEKIVETPINYQEEKITTPLEYFLVFFGASTNGETGERANWTKNSGIRFLLDSNTSFNHPLLGFLDNFAIQAASVTNEWFFDIVMTAIHDFKPLNLENTFVTVPKTVPERQEDLSRYVNQIVANGQKGWDIVKIGNGRKYKTKEGIEVTSVVTNNAGQISINFQQILGKNDKFPSTGSLDEIFKEIEAEKNAAAKTEKLVSNPKPPTNNSPQKETKPWWKFW